MDITPIDIDDGIDIKDTREGIALIDADTIAYAVCSTNEYIEELLPLACYTEHELEQLKLDPGYFEDDEGYGYIASTDLDKIVIDAKDRVTEIQHATNTLGVELYFSSGRTFRHDLTSTYKEKRRTTRYPMGLEYLKRELSKIYDGTICDGFEADDIVVYLKRHNPDKYILCAIDKDVLNSCEGIHYNYYRSARYNIDPKFIHVDKARVARWPYIQTLAGDDSDSIDGLKRVGIKTAEKILGTSTRPQALWVKVLKAYRDRGRTEEDALLNMRLVSMDQLYFDGEYKIKLWEPPKGE